MTPEQQAALRQALEALVMGNNRGAAIHALRQALEQQPADEPVAFQIFKPTPPRLAIPNVRDAELPWVYDQDPSSGNVASMWVTPVARPQPADHLRDATKMVDEPFGYFKAEPFGWTDCAETDEGAIALYERPQPAAWVGLTEDEVAVLMMEAWGCVSIAPQSAPKFARAIEAKLREKNGGGA